MTNGRLVNIAYKNQDLLEILINLSLYIFKINNMKFIFNIKISFTQTHFYLLNDNIDQD